MLSDKKTYRILVVDTDPRVHADLLSLLNLENQDYDIIAATGLNEATDKLQNSFFNLVITELRLEDEFADDDYSGFEVIRASQLLDIPVVVYTAWASLFTIRRVFRNFKAVSVVEKDSSPLQLIEEVERNMSSLNNLSRTSSPLPSPYVGPRPFRRGERLYGRQRAGQHLLDLLIAERIVLLYSPSGAGKTSLVQAQMIPELEAEGFRVLPTLRVNEDVAHEAGSGQNRAANRYVESLKRTLAAGIAQQYGVGPLPHVLASPDPNLSFSAYLNTLSSGSPASSSNGSSQDDTSHSSIFQSINPGSSQSDFDGEVLVFDQFEEILTLDPTDHERKAEFFTEVGVALRDRRRWAIFVMREEFLAGLDPYLRALPTRLSNPYRLELLPVESALSAIQEPARSVGVTFTDAAAQRLVDDLRRVRTQNPDGTTTEQLGQFVEPVQLQVVCDRLWQITQPTTDDSIDVAHIDALGSIDDALAEYYGSTVGRIATHTVGMGSSRQTADGRRWWNSADAGTASGPVNKREAEALERRIRDWFDSELITPQGIRGLVLQGAEESADLDNDIIYRLGDAHLVRAEERRGVTWFELAHDRLVEPVRRSNERWRAQNLSILQQQAQLWEAEGRPRSLLLTGYTLQAAERWARTHQQQMTDSERQFLDASRAPRRRRRLAGGLTAGLTILLLIAALVWLSQQSQIERAARELLNTQNISQSRLLAAEAQGVQEDRLDLALLLGVEAFQKADTVEARGSLFDALRESPPLLTHVSGRFGDADGVWDVAYGAPNTPLAETVIVGASDGTIHFFDAETGQPARDSIAHPSGPLRALAAGGDVIASGGVLGDLVLWRATDEDITSSLLTEFNNEIGDLVLDRDGSRLAVLSRGRLQVWQLATPFERSSIITERDGVRSVALHEELLAVSTTNRRLLVTDLESGQPVIATDSDQAYTALAINDSGSRVAGGTVTGNVEVWTISAGSASDGPAATLSGHSRAIDSLAFTRVPRRGNLPPGDALISASRDDTIQVWHVDRRSLLTDEPLANHRDRVQSVAAAPRAEGQQFGGRFVSGGRDGRVLLWDASVESRLGTRLPESNDMRDVRALATSPDGSWLAFGDSNGELVLRGIATDTVNLAPQRPPAAESLGPLRDIAFHPDAPRFATGDDNGDIALWQFDAETGELSLEQRLAQQGSAVMALAYTPDGEQLASGTFNGEVRLWPSESIDSDVGLSIHETLAITTTVVSDLAFTPDGERLLVAGSIHPTDSITTVSDVVVWNLADSAPAGEPLHYAAALRSLDPHPLPSQRIAVAGHAGAFANPSRTSSASATVLSSAASVPALGPIDASPQLLRQQAVIWDLADQSWGLALSRHRSGVLDVTFAPPDGNIIATGSEDGTAILWDAESGRTIGTPIRLPIEGLDEPTVNRTIFSQDGRTLYTADSTGTVWRWDVDPASWRARACLIANRTLTRTERRIYLRAEAAEAVCDQFFSSELESSEPAP